MRRHLLAGRSWFIRWTVTVSVAETVGFIAPAFVGTITTDLPWYAGLPLRWVMLTAGAAVAAYVLGTAVALAATESGWVRVVVPAPCGALLLFSIGGAQWLELRHHVARATSWIPATAAAWLLALGAFLIIVTPLWHEGQLVWVTVVIGVGAGAVMAFVQAAVTGWWLLRLLPRVRERGHYHVASGDCRSPDPARDASGSVGRSRHRRRGRLDGAHRRDVHTLVGSRHRHQRHHAVRRLAIGERGLK